VHGHCDHEIVSGSGVAVDSMRRKYNISLPRCKSAAILGGIAVATISACWRTTLVFSFSLGSSSNRRSRVRSTRRILLSVGKVDCLSSENAESDGGIGVGIDLGTTNSAIAYLKDGAIPTIVSIPNNGRTMPSVVTFLGDQVLVGREAWDNEIQAGGAYRNVKRILGTGGKLSPDVATVVPFVKPSFVGKTYKKDSLLNQIQDGIENPTLLTDIRNSSQVIRPEVISYHILQTLKQAAESQLGRKISRAVIGVPAYFHDTQREATRKAAEMAGFQKVKLLREPEAAALAYGVGKDQLGQVESVSTDDELVLVFDLGGGTFDVSVLMVGGGVTEIISTSGNAQLGGSVFDSRIASYCIKMIEEKSGVSTRSWSRDAKNAIVLAAEAIRIRLSNNRGVNLALPLSEGEWISMSVPSSVIAESLSDFTTAADSNTHLHVQFTRANMERLCKDEFQALLRPIREVAIMSGALLPGDSSPSVVASALELEEEMRDDGSNNLEFDDFYRDGDAESADSNPDILLAVQITSMKDAKRSQQGGRKRARDMAKQERKYRQEKKKLGESTAVQSGKDTIKIRDGITGKPISRVVLVGGATRMPGIGRLLAAITGVVPQKTVNPDEAVALGCAVHAGILDGVAGMGTVLNPMQAAILRAMARDQSLNEDEEFDDGAYDEIVYD
jgi:molecular chaperone DnaK (HSP70)